MFLGDTICTLQEECGIRIQSICSFTPRGSFTLCKQVGTEYTYFFVIPLWKLINNWINKNEHVLFISQLPVKSL